MCSCSAAATQRNRSPSTSSVACSLSIRQASFLRAISRAKKSDYTPAQYCQSEDVDDPISAGGCDPLRTPLRGPNSSLPLVEEILARTETERPMKIYNLLTFSSALEFLAILALSKGRLLKVSLISHFSFKTSSLSYRAASPTSSPRCDKRLSIETIKRYCSSPNHWHCMRRTSRPGAETIGPRADR